MSKVRVGAFSVSIDGFGAGPRQDLSNPLGVRGLELHAWFRETEVFTKMQGQCGGTTGIDNDFAEGSFDNVGAWILGEICLGRFVVLGRMTHGRAGGARILRIIRRFLCSRITRELPSRWRAARRFTLSLMDWSVL